MKRLTDGEIAYHIAESHKALGVSTEKWDWVLTLAAVHSNLVIVELLARILETQPNFWRGRIYLNDEAIEMEKP